MRLLPGGADHDRHCIAEAQSAPNRRGHRPCDDQYLPLRHLCGDSRRNPQGFGRNGEGVSAMTELGRREFLVATAAVSGGMALSLYPPESDAAETAAGMARVNARPWLPPVEGGVEVNPWIVILPDD